jgi:cyclic pyranopterin phosphate synthase
MSATAAGPSTPSLPERAGKAVRHVVRTNPLLRRSALELAHGAVSAQQELARFFPKVIQPRPRRITIAITAHCNLRCVGCRYGRDFMPGEQLTLDEVRTVLDDARAAGITTVRLYGGEPLLHRDLPAMIRHAVGLGLSPYVTTNGILLRQKVDELFDAGLRSITIGYYGRGAAYEDYTQRPGRYARLEEGLTYARSRFGNRLGIQLNYLIMRPSCNLDALHAAWDLVRRFDMKLHTDLVHYSLPYFTDGREADLQFGPDDEPAIRELTGELERLKRANPQMIPESIESIRSIPDWLLKGPGMAVPCDVRKLVWVGADGTVQLCYVTFGLGNIRERRLRDMLFTEAHRTAARDAFKLNCPNCHCERNDRILKDLPSRVRYRLL